VSRILKAYEARFRALLQRAHARRQEQGVQWLVTAARGLSVHQAIPFPEALTKVYENLATKPCFRKHHALSAPLLFFCDAGLGGLARWLRAAGHQAL
jgi:hypothetical protein